MLSTDLDDVARYNAQGAALAQAVMDHQVAVLHHPLITGLFAIYSMLILMGYIGELERSIMDAVPWGWGFSMYHPSQDSGIDALESFLKEAAGENAV